MKLIDIAPKAGKYYLGRTIFIEIKFHFIRKFNKKIYKSLLNKNKKKYFNK
jgi:hypothetical protein